MCWHYAKRGKLPSDAGINDYHKHWLGFRTTRILIDISARCIKYLTDNEAESCMNVLTESIAGYNPYFDWVVAHIGSCFPNLVIKKLLLWGLKDFSVTGVEKNSQNILLNSVIGILGHLAGSHFYDIKEALLDLFKVKYNFKLIIQTFNDESKLI